MNSIPRLLSELIERQYIIKSVSPSEIIRFEEEARGTRGATYYFSLQGDTLARVRQIAAKVEDINNLNLLKIYFTNKGYMGVSLIRVECDRLVHYQVSGSGFLKLILERKIKFGHEPENYGEYYKILRRIKELENVVNASITHARWRSGEDRYRDALVDPAKIYLLSAIQGKANRYIEIVYEIYVLLLTLAGLRVSFKGSPIILEHPSTLLDPHPPLVLLTTNEKIYTVWYQFPLVSRAILRRYKESLEKSYLYIDKYALSVYRVITSHIYRPDIMIIEGEFDNTRKLYEYIESGGMLDRALIIDAKYTFNKTALNQIQKYLAIASDLFKNYKLILACKMSNITLKDAIVVTDVYPEHIGEESFMSSIREWIFT